MDDETVREMLDDGVWDDAVEAWKRESDIDDDDVELIDELDLLDEFEFFWDAEVDRVGYECPSIPKDWKRREYADEVKSWGQVSKVNMALNDLGEETRRLLEDEIGV